MGKSFRVLLVAVGLAAVCAGVLAQEAAFDRWPTSRANDRGALQNGARLFVNYCLNCHSASLMRWNRLRDIGLDEKQIKANLIFGNQRVTDVMTVAMNPRDAKAWFGKAPPDLSVIVRARSTVEYRGTDYLYTLLRGFYRDGSTQTGWNNVVYPNIAMPNILWERQGPRQAVLTRTEYEDVPASGGSSTTPQRLVQTVSHYATDGSVTVEPKKVLDHGGAGVDVQFQSTDAAAAAEFDSDVADLVAFLNWMSEPNAHWRRQLGVVAIAFLIVFIGVGRWLNAVFWRDIH
jgi:ubiquinol-cytochrome c reductase cytochrome c1 subunit